MELSRQFIENELMATGRQGMATLCAEMVRMGFYEAPASTSASKHMAVPGGLAQHSVHVLKRARNISESLTVVTSDMKNSITICALLHDLGKAGQFGFPYYMPNILKGGKQSESKPYEVNSALLPVEHEIRSVIIAQQHIKLTDQEQFAILYHNGMYGNERYAFSGHETQLSMIIHFADMWASRVDEAGVK